MKRVLLVHHSLQPPGGGNAVGAWVLEALRGRYECDLLAWQPVELDDINLFFGTSLRPGDFNVHLMNQTLHRALDWLPPPLGLLRLSALFRTARHHLRRHDYDVLISTVNECDFGRRGIQYVHFPWAYMPRPAVDMRWYHQVPGLLKSYRRTCVFMGGCNMSHIRNNVTLANSDYISEKIRELYDVASTTVFPPVPGDFPHVDWADRENAFICIGRFAQEKDVPKVIDVIAGVRQRGHDVRLHLVGTLEPGRYGRHVLAKARACAPWVQVHMRIPRAELLSLVTNVRYGLHGMVGEHFGIAVAEMQRAGCITFVPDEGGPVEIVGRDDRLLYSSADDAVDKIDRVLRDTDTQGELKQAVDARRDMFTAERFIEQIREQVEQFGD